MSSQTPSDSEPLIAYFSSISGNTERFIGKLGLPAHRLPLRRADAPLVMERPYVLITPTYGGGESRGAVPKQVIAFLNDERNRALLRGVISAGNTNFGTAYCLAGDIISAKCQVPHMFRFELFGTPRDVEAVREGLRQVWREQIAMPQADNRPKTPTDNLKEQAT